MTSPHRIKVLYMAGAGRSASTLLGQLLGQMTGFWRAMRPRDRRLMTGLTWPLLQRYGYAISAGADL